MDKNTFPGESWGPRIGAIGSGAIFGTIAFYGFTSGKLWGAMLGIGIVAGFAFLLRKTINRVSFGEGSVMVKYFFGNTYIHQYRDIHFISYHKEGFLPTHVYLVKLKGGKKYNFYCNSAQFDGLKTYLKGKGLSDRQFLS